MVCFPMIPYCSANHVNVVIVDSIPLFYCDSRHEIYFPTLKLLHKCIIDFIQY